MSLVLKPSSGVVWVFASFLVLCSAFPYVDIQGGICSDDIARLCMSLAVRGDTSGFAQHTASGSRSSEPARRTGITPAQLLNAELDAHGAAQEDADDHDDFEAQERQTALQAAKNAQTGNTDAAGTSGASNRRLKVNLYHDAHGVENGFIPSGLDEVVVMHTGRSLLQGTTVVLQQGKQVRELLGKLGLPADTSVSDMLKATAPVARCLRNAIFESQTSIHPHTPSVSPDCEADVRQFFTDMAEDIRKDLPLLAMCAPDILRVCPGNITYDGGTLLLCLKQNRKSLGTPCKTAVTMRQIESGEDLALDAAVNAACREDRERLCGQEEWGGGRAQLCLERYLYLDQLSAIAPEPPRELPDPRGVSVACINAIFNKEMEQSEDIRFNYPLASSCAAAKKLYCPEVRPSSPGLVITCLEAHSSTLGFSDSATKMIAESCSKALQHHSLLKAMDVRLDNHFRNVCVKDVMTLCLSEESQVMHSREAAPGKGAHIMECLRRERSKIKVDACAAHMRTIMRKAYQDNRFDTLFQSTCEEDIRRQCRDRRSALHCLKEAKAKHADLEPECGEMLRERASQAAADLAFLSDLEQACQLEVATLCTSKPGHAVTSHLDGAQVIDCLADHRNAPEFGKECRKQLLAHLQDATSDVRMLHTLHKDCRDDINKLCSGIKPGEGRVLSCLQQNRVSISSPQCKRQMLRLMGLAVEDVRLNFNTSRACKVDILRYCAGLATNTTTEPGKINECLRKSIDHLSEECRKAQEELEKAEHEDVRLNPRIQQHCAAAISVFCGQVAPGNANVISCLYHASSKREFPPECRDVMTSLMERASLKYSLNVKLKSACDGDVAKMCSHESDEAVSVSQPGILGCLAANSSALGTSCRAEMAALVRLHLNKYTMGMPLTAACDGDVMARCHVDKQVTPFLMGGQILSCLAKNSEALHKPCWALISMFDDAQYHTAVVLESKPWQPQLQREQLTQIKAEVVTQVRSQIEDAIAVKLKHRVAAAIQEHHGKVLPMIQAAVNATSFMITFLIVAVLLSLYAWARYRRRTSDHGKARTIAIKDARV